MIRPRYTTYIRARPNAETPIPRPASLDAFPDAPLGVLRDDFFSAGARYGKGVGRPFSNAEKRRLMRLGPKLPMVIYTTGSVTPKGSLDD